MTVLESLAAYGPAELQELLDRDLTAADTFVPGMGANPEQHAGFDSLASVFVPGVGAYPEQHEGLASLAAGNVFATGVGAHPEQHAGLKSLA